MYNQTFHQLEQRICKLLNLIEVYKYSIVTNNKKKEQYKQNIHDFIDKEYVAMKQDSLQHYSLIHYNYFQFITDQKTQPIDELTVGHTIKYINNIQQRLYRIHQLLSLFL
ncbi:hypothetical protein BU065_08850 [Staphylococcus succinus]|uniref:hypothetical protein n=1 Tax=Staphylococcus succinus TaxID=61015 RepID=UPI000E690B7F|nr:hypothetical protein [Staphylococcus succinus]MEB8127076.1 hypothetical protein [Staphylococcus succinus]MEB8209919.1 hypothetical protein [Staphylococcus succinus]RIN34132.1 hypothetical protein BU065_08850 [Staphylococcus succinus]